MDKTSYDFLDVLRGTIEDKVSTLDQTIYCKIVGINEDYTLDVTVVPDETTRIRSVVNASKYEFKVGDYGILYKIGNNLANAFIIAKLGPSDEDNRPLSKQVSGGGDEDGSGESVVAGDGLTSSGTDTVTVSLGTPSASGFGSNTYGSNNVTADSHTHQINLPDATDSAKGVVQLAADNDTTSTNKAVTPKQLETARKNAAVSKQFYFGAFPIDTSTDNTFNGAEATALRFASPLQVTKSGNTTTVTLPSVIQKYTTTITGDGKTTDFTVQHGLGTGDVQVSVYLTGQTIGRRTGNELVMVDTYVENGVTHQIHLVFATAPTASQTFKVVVIG